MPDIVGVAFVLLLAGFSAAVLWRNPHFRREFVAYWSQAEIARRIAAWAARSRGPGA